MRAYELDEGWKDTLTNVGIAGAMAAAGAASTYVQGTFDKDEAPTPITRSAPTPITRSSPDHAKPEVKAVAKATEVKAITGRANETLLKDEAIKQGITGTELAAFMSQMHHESMGFRAMKERNKNNVAKYEPGHKSGKAKILGNTEKGDGARFMGRGYTQLTGRWNYTNAEKHLKLGLVKNPELAAKPEIAAKIAVSFWKQRVRPNVTDYNDVKSETRKINPNYHGLKQRQELFKVYSASLTNGNKTV